MRRYLLGLVVLLVPFVGISRAAVSTATLTQTRVDTHPYCSASVLEFHGIPGDDGLTIAGVDGLPTEVERMGPTCGRLPGDVFFNELTAKIATNETCKPLNVAGERVALLPITRTAWCGDEIIDHAIIDTGSGHDSIRLGPWQVTTTEIFAGSGADAIRALNGAYDIISCGPDVDVVIADATDVIGADCEKVQLQL
jgi:hypothetical protein